MVLSRSGSRVHANSLAHATGWVLVALATGLLVYSVIAGLGQFFYYQGKYGSASNDDASAFRALHRSHRLYPHNFYASSFAADRAWHAARRTEDPEERDRLYRESTLWTQRGLRQNGYDRSLRLRWAALLAREDVHEAVRFMEAYLQIHFWDPWHHAVMAELYAKAGELDRAQAELYWVKRVPEYHRKAKERVRRGTDEFLRNLPAQD